MDHTKGDLPFLHSLAYGLVSQYVSRNSRGIVTGWVDGQPFPKLPKLALMAYATWSCISSEHVYIHKLGRNIYLVIRRVDSLSVPTTTSLLLSK